MRTGWLPIWLLAPASMQAQPAPREWYCQKLPQQIMAITSVMYHDVTNPPAAARFYAYTALAGYELLSAADPTLPGFQRSWTGYPSSVISSKADRYFASLYCILETGKGILPSGYLLDSNQLALVKEYKQWQPDQAMIDSCTTLAQQVAQGILRYSRTDGYFTLSTRARYRPLAGEGYWKPTAPEYMPAVEPHWRTIRPFLLDSAMQCKPLPPEVFSADPLSSFYQLAQEVYTTGRQLTAEQIAIANFWDCNPFAVQFAGHMSVGLKKISPGGHWMGITGILCEQQHLAFEQAMLLHALVACSLHDAFICCWDEKYRSNRIRPETAINRLIDEKWKPFLQTPPFPEYTSGHSVISTTAAEVLTYFVGDGIAFTDSTEAYIGLPARRFSSFRAAAGEAAISRLYGGIHYRDAVENGQEQGRRIAECILKKLRLPSFKL